MKKIVLNKRPFNEKQLIPTIEQFQELIASSRKKDRKRFVKCINSVDPNDDQDDEIFDEAREANMVMLSIVIVDTILVYAKYLFLRKLILDLISNLPTEDEIESEGEISKEKIMYMLSLYYPKEFSKYIEITF